MDIKPGSRWSSGVCDGEFVIVRPPSAAGELRCGGEAVVPHGTPREPGGSPGDDWQQGTLTAKRYADLESGLELLCSRGGAGGLSFDGRPMALKEAKKLPSSD
ncbi:hypothetical protein [Sphingopyxis sp.]|jgi:hypothetical protein|uniref:hypothetical protein n=1 Tax=Sphingopyxis sp. TaxID=1908224 RepID=UPI003F707776